jgi:hypothetical protein
MEKEINYNHDGHVNPVLLSYQVKIVVLIRYEVLTVTGLKVEGI